MIYFPFANHTLKQKKENELSHLIIFRKIQINLWFFNWRDIS
jgi:hypothetical protein